LVFARILEWLQDGIVERQGGALVIPGVEPMSAYPDSEIRVESVSWGRLSPVRFAALATVLGVLGLSAIWPTVYSLWVMWTTDALKSIGMMIPPVSLILILRAWKRLGWAADGTWWGLSLILVTIAVSRIQLQSILIMVVSPHWSTVLPPPSAMLLAYGSGVVLLAGGVRLYRAALFPIVLLWFANPIPHAFNLLVDLPLQHASAYIARAFAMHLGHSLTPDHLRLMFTPEFGMFIAPGCNGIRGSVTMGFIALIAGYVYRFRWYANALVVTGAILLGYVFNLLRLCLLVLYYMVALHFPSLQNKAENADYLIGAALFLVATILLFTVIQRLRDARNASDLEAAAVPEGGGVDTSTPRAQYRRLAVMGVVVLLGCAWLADAAMHPPPVAMADVAAARFPKRLGGYSLVRSWNETLPTGLLAYVWAQYAPVGGGTPIAIGVSPELGWHDPLVCHVVRGEQPLWQGQLTFETAGVVPINFDSAFYNDGLMQYLEASTLCNDGICNESVTDRTHFGFIYTRPDPKSLLGGEPRRPIPVVLRIETVDMALSSDSARQQLANDLRGFLTLVNLADLTRPYSR
jgi:exosortase J